MLEDLDDLLDDESDENTRTASSFSNSTKPRSKRSFADEDATSEDEDALTSGTEDSFYLPAGIINDVAVDEEKFFNTFEGNDQERGYRSDQNVPKFDWKGNDRPFHSGELPLINKTWSLDSSFKAPRKYYYSMSSDSEMDDQRTKSRDRSTSAGGPEKSERPIHLVQSAEVVSRPTSESLYIPQRAFSDGNLVFTLNPRTHISKDQQELLLSRSPGEVSEASPPNSLSNSEEVGSSPPAHSGYMSGPAALPSYGRQAATSFGMPRVGYANNYRSTSNQTSPSVSPRNHYATANSAYVQASPQSFSRYAYRPTNRPYGSARPVPNGQVPATAFPFHQAQQTNNPFYSQASGAYPQFAQNEGGAPQSGYWPAHPRSPKYQSLPPGQKHGHRYREEEKKKSTWKVKYPQAGSEPVSPTKPAAPKEPDSAKSDSDTLLASSSKMKADIKEDFRPKTILRRSSDGSDVSNIGVLRPSAPIFSPSAPVFSPSKPPKTEVDAPKLAETGPKLAESFAELKIADAKAEVQ
eukprot:TRINITY_DN3331_c0_g1_i5.p1 TRINITY_DN3331_c0_g1~~TRINITY_DN3331_c0_g1_i5.p1  ORF type:complete len:522 (+),score=102.01 TRINITY_DN3331_c0_g1_i5:218-1783(+)